jgi:hypothetical protein
MRSIVFGFLVALLVGGGSSAFGQANEKASYKVKVTEAKALTPDKPGATSVKVKAQIEITNDGTDVLGVSSRIFEYKLVKKGKTKDQDEVHPVFGHVDPDQRDARGLEAGKTTKLDAELEGSSVVIDKNAKYELRVKGYGKEIVVPLMFK